MRAGVSTEALLASVLLLFLVLANLTESVLLRQNTLWWCLYVMVTFSGRAGSRPEPRVSPAPR
jgi:hypothetical protein